MTAPLNETPSSPPPPVRTRRPWPLIVAGAVVAVLIVLVVANIDRGETDRDRPSRLDAAVDLAAPDALSNREQRSSGAGLVPDAGIKLESGAWVEVADPETGRLAQRYYADRVDPLPDQWMRMEQPRSTYFLSGGRLVTMRSDTAIAHIPRQAIDSGTLKGNVVIRLYRPSGDRPVNLDTDRPALEILADEAQYDDLLGQIRCDESIEVLTPSVRFKGRGLTMLLNEAGDAPEQLVVDEALEPIRIDLVKLEAERAGDVASAEPPPGSAPVPSDAPSTASAPTRVAVDDGTSTAAPAPSAPVTSATPATPAATGTLAATTGFYRLTLHDDVVVTRTLGENVSTIHGDTLTLTFSLDSAKVGDAMALGPRRPARLASADRRARQPAPWLAQVAATPFAVPRPVQSPPSVSAGLAPPPSDVVEITYSGRMVMVPVEPGMPHPESADDVRLRIVGDPVRLEDPSSRSVGRCAWLQYDALPQRLELVGNAVHPLDVHSDRFEFRGDRFWLVRGTGLGRIEGPGRMSVNDTPSAVLDPYSHLRLALASADSDGAVALIATMLPRQSAEGDEPVGEAAGAPASGGEALEITWRDGVDLEFEPTADGDAGALRAARFQGDVRVRSPDFALRSAALDVEFDPESETGGAEGQAAAIRVIDASGGVMVNRVADRGSLASERLRVTMERHDGTSVPEKMVATGNVAASDPAQSIWAGRLEVTFRPRPDAPDEDAPDDDTPAPTGAATEDAPNELGNVEVNTVAARDDVRVLLKDGTRVFADTLDGNSAQRRLRLGGGDLMIVNGRFVADRLRELRIDEGQGTATSTGPGRFLYFNEPVPMPREGRTDRPALTARPALEGAWTRSLRYDDGANNGGGSIELAGDVAIQSEPDPTGEDFLGGEDVRFDLRRISPGVTSGVALPGTTASDGGDRTIARIVSTGGAVAESKRWETADRAGDPTLFKVDGDHLEYDTVTREALVDGAGGLLVHDVTDDPRRQTETAQSTFGSKGTSKFSWGRRMTMNREIDDRYVIVMEKDVEVLHLGVRDGDTLTLTGDRLEVTVLRPESAQGEPTGSGRADDPIDLGGPAKLIRIKGLGQIFIRTDAQDIECHEFDYNVDTGLAQIRARPGRKVRVQMKESAAPLQAESMTWDLRTGTIQITGAAGRVGR